MSTKYAVTIPYEYDMREGKQKSFQRVGTAFTNKRKRDGEEFISVNINVPVILSPKTGICLFKLDDRPGWDRDADKPDDSNEVDDEIPF